MSQQGSTEPESIFNTVVFAIILLAGGFVGRLVCGAVLPENETALLMSTAMVPLGIVIGVSIGLGTMPPLSIMNFFSVLGGRHTVDEIVAGGGTGGSTSLAVGTALGTAGTCAAFAVGISTFLKPEVGLGELMMTFGGFGLAYGAFVAGVVWFVLGGD